MRNFRRAAAVRAAPDVRDPSATLAVLLQGQHEINSQVRCLCVDQCEELCLRDAPDSMAGDFGGLFLSVLLFRCPV